MVLNKQALDTLEKGFFQLVLLPFEFHIQVFAYAIFNQYYPDEDNGRARTAAAWISASAAIAVGIIITGTMLFVAHDDPESCCRSGRVQWIVVCIVWMPAAALVQIAALETYLWHYPDGGSARTFATGMGLLIAFLFGLISLIVFYVVVGRRQKDHGTLLGSAVLAAKGEANDSKASTDESDDEAEEERTELIVVKRPPSPSPPPPRSRALGDFMSLS